MTRATVTLEIAGLAVTVPAGDEPSALDGLPAGEENASWALGSGAFMVSTGGGPGHTPDGFLAGERARADAVEVLCDEAVAGPAGPARRIVLRSRRREDRDWVEGDGVRPVEVPEREVQEEIGFLFATGPGGTPVRAGYRVPLDAPDDALVQLRRMLDETRVEPA